MSELAYIISYIISFLPIFIILYFGPKANKTRISYLLIGFLTRSIIGIAFFIAGEQGFLFSEEFNLWLRVSYVAVVGFTEEVIRYPTIIKSQDLTSQYVVKEPIVSKSQSLDAWTRIRDPHGMAMYLGAGWGASENFGLYLIPNSEDLLNGVAYVFSDHLLFITYRITAIIAHISLTYLAMTITINRGFYRFTILLHIFVNVANELFREIATNESSNLLFLLYTRFSIVLVTYFMLRPRIRYLSPAVLLFLQTLLFLAMVLFGSIVYLIVLLFNSGISDLFS